MSTAEVNSSCPHCVVIQLADMLLDTEEDTESRVLCSILMDLPQSQSRSLNLTFILEKGVSAYGSPLVTSKVCASTVCPSSVRCALAPAHMQSEDGSDIERKQEGLCENMCTQAGMCTQPAVQQNQTLGLERWLRS